jgi:type IV pilus assembly protein PilF
VKACFQRTKLAAVSTALLVFAALGGCVSTTTGPVKTEPNEAAAAQQYYELGARYYRAGNYEMARDRLTRALDFDPRMAIAHSTLALTYEQLDVPRLAAEHYDKAVRYEPRNINVRNTYAVFLCRQGRFDEAREQFERVVGFPENDNPEVALTNAGVCMLQKPDVELAEQYFRQALDRKPRYAEALLQMVLLERSTGDTLSARAFLQRFMSVQPLSPSLLLLAVQIEEEMGNESARRDYMQQLFEMFPDSDEAQRLREAS